MTERQSVSLPLVHLDLASWHFLVEAPGDVLLFDLSVIHKCSPLQHVEDEGLIQILSPCGVIYLHHDRHVERNRPVRDYHLTGIDAPLLTILLCTLAKDEAGPVPDVDESAGVSFARRFSHYYGFVHKVTGIYPCGALERAVDFGHAYLDDFAAR